MITAAEAKNLTRQGQNSLVASVMDRLKPTADKAIRSAAAAGFNTTGFIVECEERLVGAFCTDAHAWFEALGYTSSAETCTEYDRGYTGNIRFSVGWK